MHPRFRTRQALQLVLTGNALRPPRAPVLGVPAFFAGWLTGELAPQLLALTAADAAAHLARNRRAELDRVDRVDTLGLAMAGLSVAGLTALIASAGRAREVVRDALDEAIGADRRVPPPPAARLRVDRNLPYADGGRRYRLDVYRPAEDGHERPVLLQVHGGAWLTGSKDQQGIPLMRHMARRGWVCVAINYPLSPTARWPTHAVAAKRALAWIREHIHDYGGDPSFVATTGGSAGGHLAALLAVTQNDTAFQPGFEGADTSVQACVPHYGVYDFAGTSGSRASAERRRRLLAPYIMGTDPADADYVAASPLDRVTADVPPFFVIHGALDTMVPVREARRFVRRLRESSPNPVAYAEIPGAQHAFDLFPSIRSVRVLEGVERFLTWACARPRGATRTGSIGT